MASPISAHEVIVVAKFAYRLYTSCKAAKGEFESISVEVSTMSAAIQLVHLELENPKSIINQIDDKAKTIRKQLGIHINNCKKALLALEKLLERYNQMTLPDRAAWALWGKAEVAGMKADLSSLATQLDNWVDSLTFKAVSLVNRNMLRGIGRIEEALETLNGNVKVAVAEYMQDMEKSGASREQLRRCSAIISGYAKEVCSSENFRKTQRAHTPDPPRRRHENTNTLGVSGGPRRAKSVDTSKTNKDANKQRRALLRGSLLKKPKHTLECWLIQIKSGQALIFTFQISEKEKQIRGQCKLEEMASHFNLSSDASMLKGDHDLVQWVVKDRKKHESNIDYTWQPYAAKLEPKGSLYLGLGIAEQAMVIIKRQLTAEAQETADKKETIAVAEEKEAAKRKAEEAAARKLEENRQKRRTSEEQEAKREARLVMLLETEKLKVKAAKQKVDEAAAKRTRDDRRKRRMSEEREAKMKAEKDEVSPKIESKKAKQAEHAAAPKISDNSKKDCRYFPDCKNPSCEFRHPKMPMCRYGSACTVKDCRFTHKNCISRPCTNSKCEYKHDEGQQITPDLLKPKSKSPRSPKNTEKAARKGDDSQKAKPEIPERPKNTDRKAAKRGNELQPGLDKAAKQELRNYGAFALNDVMRDVDSKDWSLPSSDDI